MQNLDFLKKCVNLQELIFEIFVDSTKKTLGKIPETLTKLKVLKIANIPINVLPKTLTNLEILDCSHTQINEIPESLSNLKELNCAGTAITEIPNEYQKLKTLILPNTIFKLPIIPTLKILSCHSNESIEKIPKELINLEELYCSNLNITKLPKTLIKLKILDCSYTKITKIPKTYTLLKILDCTKTDIEKISSKLINLRVLHCYFTKIKKIPKTLIHLKSVYSSDHCDNLHPYDNIKVKLPENLEETIEIKSYGCSWIGMCCCNSEDKPENVDLIEENKLKDDLGDELELFDK
jgi:Leucine-rich repeat (LRR) protein